MPAFQSVILTDRATPTPVAHTLVPESKTNDSVYNLVEPGSVAIGLLSLSISHRKSPTRHKTRLVLSSPVVQTETINGVSVPKVVRAGIADLTFSFYPNSSEQERKDVVGMLQSALEAAKVLVNDTVVKNTGIY